MTQAIQHDLMLNIIFLNRGDKYMKIIEADMTVKVKVDSFGFVYVVSGGRRFYKFQIKWLNKHNKPWSGYL